MSAYVFFLSEDLLKQQTVSKGADAVHYESHERIMMKDIGP